MLQEVNLIDELPAPVPIKLNLPRVVTAAGALAILLLIYYFLFMRNQVQQLQFDKSALTQQVKIAETQYILMQARLKALPEEGVLPQKVAELRDRVTAQEELSAVSSTLSSNTAVHFSAVFTALAEVSVNGLWLQHIIISNHGLSLSGITYQESIVSEYLSLLTQKSIMKPYHFKVLDTKEIDKKTTGFTLSTDKVTSNE